MTDTYNRSTYRRIVAATLEAQAAVDTLRKSTQHESAEINRRLTAAATARESESRWIKTRLDETIAAVGRGLSGLPDEVNAFVTVSPPALSANARDGLQAATGRAQSAAEGIHEGRRSLLLWRARQSSIRGGVGIVVLAAVALIGLWVIRVLSQEQMTEAEATGTAKALAAINLTSQADAASIEAEATASAGATVAAGATATAEAIAAITLTAQAEDENEHSSEAVIHIVQPGENLFRIGLEYGISVDELMAYNNLSDATDIVVGQSIKIPLLAMVPKNPEGGRLIRSINRGRYEVVQVFVPEGSFPMGSTGGEDDERPIHTRQLDGFWLDRTEVTNGQYAECVAAGACSLPEDDASHTRPDYYGDPAFADYPVIWVSWADAEAFCRLSGGRLPTEAEWEYAARGPSGYEFPWGDPFDGERLNYCDANCPFDWADRDVDDGHQDTAPVGSYPEGAAWSGALDMAGNVWEWVYDWYDESAYDTLGANDLDGPDDGQLKILRGGAWYGDARVSRSADRNSRAALFANSNIGFRCAANPGDVPTPRLIRPTPTPITLTPTAEVCQHSPGARWGPTLWALYDERLNCALNQEMRMTGAFQLFNNGLTVWRQDRNLIYVLYYNGRFAAYPDNSPPGYYESDLIRRGFGYLWRNNQTVQQGLGQPRAAEANTTDFAIQDFRGGTIFYFYENNARNYALFNDDGTWTSIQE